MSDHEVFIDANIVNPFLDGTVRAFREMFYLEADFGKPYLVDRTGNHRWEVTGIVGLVGDSEGIVSMRLTHFLAGKLLDATGLVIDKDEERPQLLNGLVCEIVNVISSKATAEISILNVSVTPPFTVQGKNHQVSWPSKTPIIGVPFHTKFGPFAVELSMLSKKVSL